MRVRKIVNITRGLRANGRKIRPFQKRTVSFSNRLGTIHVFERLSLKRIRTDKEKDAFGLDRIGAD